MFSARFIADAFLDHKLFDTAGISADTVCDEQ